MSKLHLARMTWKEAEEAYARNPVVLLPNASIEEHGPQTPTGDFRALEIVAERIAQNTGSIVGPMLPCGYSEVHRRFPGCVTLAPTTVEAILYDMAQSFLDHGLDHLLFLCGHNGNMPLINHVARRIRRESGIVAAALEPWRLFSPAFLKKVYGLDSPPIGHGSDPMTSLALHLYPEDVRMDLVDEGHTGEFQGLPVKGMSQIPVGDVAGHIYLDMRDLAENGVLGNTSIASADVGRQLIERVVEVGSRFVELFQEIDTQIQHLDVKGGRRG